jgi:1,4-alpha-glucan branching enzyme
LKRRPRYFLAGYGIQNFLEVEPHFGTREDLQEVVRVAHANGIYVILDIILNHAGNVLKCIYSTDASQIGQSVTVEARNGKAVSITVPAAGFVIFE